MDLSNLPEICDVKRLASSMACVCIIFLSFCATVRMRQRASMCIELPEMHSIASISSVSRTHQLLTVLVPPLQDPKKSRPPVPVPYSAGICPDLLTHSLSQRTERWSRAEKNMGEQSELVQVRCKQDSLALFLSPLSPISDCRWISCRPPSSAADSHSLQIHPMTSYRG